MLAWLKEQVGGAFDPYSASQCQGLAALSTELKDLCSVKVTRDFHLLVVTDIECVFADAMRGVCLPLLKGARSGEANAPGQVGAEFARAYIVQQLRRVLHLLRNAFVFRTNKLFKAEWAAKWAWLALTEQCLPCALKLFKAGGIQVSVLRFVSSLHKPIMTLVLSCDVRRTRCWCWMYVQRCWLSSPVCRSPALQRRPRFLAPLHLATATPCTTASWAVGRSRQHSSDRSRLLWRSQWWVCEVLQQVKAKVKSTLRVQNLVKNWMLILELCCKRLTPWLNKYLCCLKEKVLHHCIVCTLI